MSTTRPDIANEAAQSIAPAPSGQVAIVLLGLAASLALLALHQAALPWRDHARMLTLAYTLTLAAPLGAALLLRRAGDAYAWLCTLAVALLWGALAWHEGGMMLPTAASAWSHAGIWIYAVTSAVALFLVLAFAGAYRTSPRRLTYPALFAVAWSHELALVVAQVFTAMGWLLLGLWAGLFQIIGIALFAEVFSNVHFAYPATGVLFGLGLMFGRNQAGMIRAMLRVCRVLGMVLLPVIALVGLSFALALPFTGLEGLWDTRHAAALLITLVLATVALTNAVFQDGTRGDPPYPRWLRWFVNGALAVLPVFAALALLAFAMRVRQYGWTVERLFGVLVAGVALLFAVGYALALWAARPGTWLRLAAPVNMVTALVLIVGLLASHAPGTDFRSLAARSQLARALRDPAKADIAYLRWQLGQPGVAALRALEADPALAAHPEVQAAIRAELARQARWTAALPEAADPATRLAVYPHSTAVPDGLWPALLAGISDYDKQQLGGCRPTTCVMLGVDLDGDGQYEWLLLSSPGVNLTQAVLALTSTGWHVVGSTPRHDGYTQEDWTTLRKALAAGTWQTHPPRYQDLWIGKQQYVVAPRP